MINFDYLYDKSYYGNELAVNHRKDDNLHWKVIPGGIILPMMKGIMEYAAES